MNSPALIEPTIDSNWGVPMTKSKSPLLPLLLLSATVLSAPVVVHAASLATKTVTSGETWVVSTTTNLSYLKVDSGGNIVAPAGYSVTLTVNGVETGQALITTAGTDTDFVAGTYYGDVVLTVTLATPVDFSAGPGAPQVFPFRQALYLDATGVVEDKSVPAAVFGVMPTAFDIRDIVLASTGQDFNGVYAAGGKHTIENMEVEFDGNGRSDFAGVGAAVAATGTSTKLTLDNVHIFTHGVVRTGVVATGGSNVTVKNSEIYTRAGVLPADYVLTVNLAQMRSIPWMLGINGNDNVRATNLLGPSSIASYVNSSITSEDWGVLSTDSGSDCTLTAINSNVTIAPGHDGYGSYAIGNATEYFLGVRFDVGTYATINTGGSVYYGDSTRQEVANLNSALSIGLSSWELSQLKPQHTIVNSRRFGVMWHSSSGTVNISGGTQFNTAEDTFLDKSSEAVTITVDGSQGARLRPKNGIIMQVMDDDDPGPQGSALSNTGVYVEPTTTPTRNTSFDTTSTTSAAVGNFSNIDLVGDFYNSSGWTLMAGSGGPGGSTTAGDQNLALNFDNATITGIITSAEAHHHVATIDSAQYMQLGEVTNTPRAAINNGAIVSLTNASRWVMTGTSYLTSLYVGAGSSIAGKSGHGVSMTVNGTATSIAPDTTYTGALVLTLN
jgi:hypothetical protein